MSTEKYRSFITLYARSLCTRRQTVPNYVVCQISVYQKTNSAKLCCMPDLCVPEDKQCQIMLYAKSLCTRRQTVPNYVVCQISVYQKTNSAKFILLQNCNKQIQFGDGDKTEFDIKCQIVITILH